MSLETPLQTPSREDDKNQEESSGHASSGNPPVISNSNANPADPNSAPIPEDYLGQRPVNNNASLAAAANNLPVNNPINRNPPTVNGNAQLPQAMIRPPGLSDTMYQFQFRALLVLIIALAFGFLYLQFENQSVSLNRYKLLPTTTYDALQLAKQQQLQEHAKQQLEKKSAPPPPPPSTPPPEPEDSDEDFPSSSDLSSTTPGESMIPEKFQLQAKYLSRVLQTIGDLSRKLEEGQNITKPIGGIIEMRTEVLKDEEDEDEEKNVPEYMKELGSIINDIKKTNTPKGKRVEKFRPTIKKSPPPPPPTQNAREELKRKQTEWDEFMDSLMETLGELQREEKRKQGILNEEEDPSSAEDQQPSQEIKSLRNKRFLDDEETERLLDENKKILEENKKLLDEGRKFLVDDEDESEFDDSGEEVVYPPEHYEMIKKQFPELHKAFDFDLESDGLDDSEAGLEELEDDAGVEEERESIFDETNKQLLELLKVMVEAQNFVKKAEAMKKGMAEVEQQESQSGKREESAKQKSRLEKDYSYSL